MRLGERIVGSKRSHCDGIEEIEAVKMFLESVRERIGMKRRRRGKDKKVWERRR